MSKTIEGGGEIGAMQAIESAFSSLDPDARGRVLRWAADRFAIAVQQNRQPAAAATSTAGAKVAIEATQLAELYAQASPDSEPEKALVVAYWLQFVNGQPDLESQQINTELKQLGHGLANITRALEALKDQKPQLVVQTRKEGTTKQARKKYRITEEGRKAVQLMIARQ